MHVYIANFGRGNFEWPLCYERGTVATMIHAATKPFYDAGDKEGFIDWCIANRKAASGLTPTRSVAARWFGAMKTVESTTGDIWFHRADDKLWWTTSKDEPGSWEQKPSQDPMQNGAMTYVCHKPCDKWSNQNRKGNRLEWNALHPKAKHFLFTEGTLQKLSDDNATYAMALIAGDDLAEWESRTEWKASAERSKRNPGKIYNPWEKTLWSIIDTVKNTVGNSNGQLVERTAKNKEMQFTEDGVRAYIEALHESQEGFCAISGIPMQCVGEADDSEMIYSLDRIDSDGHYEPGNLQLVCRFINRWKNDGRDSEFRRLINIVKKAE